jgi:hypothetical protein
MQAESPITQSTKGVAIIPSCSTKKRFFISQSEAVQFEAQNRKTYNFAKQFAYKCESCIGWHLTSIPPDAYTLAKSHIYEGSKASAIQRLTGTSKRDRDQKMLDLYTAGKKRHQIAEETGYTYQTVCAILRSFDDHSARAAAKSQSLSTLDEIAEKKKTLLAELDRLTQTERQIIERKALKLLPCRDGAAILIEKEGNRLALALPDCKELVEKLAAMLAEGQPLDVPVAIHKQS